MNFEVHIPQQGLTTETVMIVKWLKNIGDEVEEGEILFETESEKAVLEVESLVKGKLIKILVEAGDEADIGQAAAIIETK
jgi:pyruvate dehydrogenase E2 component (dihydrolipoamide acetyltransferase)